MSARVVRHPVIGDEPDCEAVWRMVRQRQHAGGWCPVLSLALDRCIQREDEEREPILRGEVPRER